jgi:hypothetical protein
MNAHTKMQNFKILTLIKTIIFNSIFNSPCHSKDLNLKELDFLSILIHRFKIKNWKCIFFNYFCGMVFAL